MKRKYRIVEGDVVTKGLVHLADNATDEQVLTALRLARWPQWGLDLEVESLPGCGFALYRDGQRLAELVLHIGW